MEVYRKSLDAFGFNATFVDGLDVEELCKAFSKALEYKGSSIIA